jgi:hypothetical protein
VIAGDIRINPFEDADRLVKVRAEATDASARPEIIAPRRPTRVDLTGPGSGTGPEVMERLTRLDGTSDEVTDALAEQTEDGTKDVVAQLLAQARNGGDGE